MSSRKLRWVLIGGGLGAIIVTVVLSLVIWRWAEQQRLPVPDNTAHSDYAALYDAAWRQDEAKGSTVMTATLLTPQLVDLLRADQQRLETDEQVNTALASLPANAVPFVVTLDAVRGSAGATTTDAAIKTALTVTASAGSYTVVSLVPVVSTPVATNINSTVPTVHRVWVVVFQSDAVIDWPTLQDLQLSAAGIDGVQQRKFIWSRPGITITD